MELQLREGMLISDLQKMFSDIYPFLKLEFFRNKHAVHKLSPKLEKINPNTTILPKDRSLKSFSLNVNEGITVGELEKECWNKTGLAVQVFRKSRNLWIETSLTDDWTLGKQNKTAESFVLQDDRSMDQKLDDEQYDPG